MAETLQQRWQQQYAALKLRSNFYKSMADELGKLMYPTAPPNYRPAKQPTRSP